LTKQFDELEKFITKKMRMSHVYQPVMLLELLTNGGSADVNAIAKSLLLNDQSQIQYYEQITKNMVGTVLTKKRGITEKEGDKYSLPNFTELQSDEVDTLIELCQSKVDEYVAKRGDKIWEHRTKSSGDIPGTSRYNIFKRAKFRCELCGISAEVKALEVDHIVPRNNGGSDDESNLQSLCYSCNATKRDRDDTDFRGVADSYNDREAGCVFCEIDRAVIAENELAYAIRDGFPVTSLHALVIPKRHVADYFDLYQPELNAINQLLQRLRSDITGEDDTVSGFNVGVNAGESAGQTVFHCHVHLIPRRTGDVEEPRGGVRGVVAGKQRY
jgi:diadenosine tetraphosphate (Ap4A) HIT family hydrolase/5-methylcytosine-specific restriction endonuclease McrA